MESPEFKSTIIDKFYQQLIEEADDEDGIRTTEDIIHNASRTYNDKFQQVCAKKEERNSKQQTDGNKYNIIRYPVYIEEEDDAHLFCREADDEDGILTTEDIRHNASRTYNDKFQKVCAEKEERNSKQQTDGNKYNIIRYPIYIEEEEDAHLFCGVGLCDDHQEFEDITIKEEAIEIFPSPYRLSKVMSPAAVKRKRKVSESQKVPNILYRIDKHFENVKLMNKLKEYEESTNSYEFIHEAEFLDDALSEMQTYSKERKLGTLHCPECGKIYMHKYSLNRHYEFHHKHNKPHRLVCGQCGYSYANKVILKKHIDAVHRKLKPYICPFCQSTFSDSGNMHKHIQGHHKKIRPYQCNECPQRLTTRNGLESHIISVHQKLKPHKCSDCDKAFSVKGNLIKHKATVHENVKPHVCSFCKYRFGEKGNLNKHLSHMHKQILNSDIRGKLVKQFSPRKKAIKKKSVALTFNY